MSITFEQCQAARALVGLDQEKLASKAVVPPDDIVDFEKGSRTPSANALAAIRKALEFAGVIFIDEDDAGGPGVRLSKAQKRQGEWSPTGPDGTQTSVGQPRPPKRRK